MPLIVDFCYTYRISYKVYMLCEVKLYTHTRTYDAAICNITSIGTLACHLMCSHPFYTTNRANSARWTVNKRRYRASGVTKTKPANHFNLRDRKSSPKPSFNWRFEYWLVIYRKQAVSDRITTLGAIGRMLSDRTAEHHDICTPRKERSRTALDISLSRLPWTTNNYTAAYFPS